MNGDVQFTAEDIAPRIGKTTHWVKRHARHLPHHKMGRSYGFTEADVQAIIKAAAREPVSEASGFHPVGYQRAS